MFHGDASWRNSFDNSAVRLHVELAVVQVEANLPIPVNAVHPRLFNPIYTAIRGNVECDSSVGSSLLQMRKKFVRPQSRYTQHEHCDPELIMNETPLDQDLEDKLLPNPGPMRQECTRRLEVFEDITVVHLLEMCR